MELEDLPQVIETIECVLGKYGTKELENHYKSLILQKLLIAASEDTSSFAEDYDTD